MGCVRGLDDLTQVSGQLLAEVTRMIGTPVSHRAAELAQAVHAAVGWSSKTVSVLQPRLGMGTHHACHILSAKAGHRPDQTQQGEQVSPLNGKNRKVML